MKAKWTILPVVLLIAQLACRSSARQTDTPAQPPAITAVSVTIPDKYRRLYDYLDQTLDSDLDTFRDLPPAGRADPIFAAELIVANGNRGEELLRPETPPAVALYLDRLQAMGVRGVKNPIPFPLLTPDFPRSEEYLEFYRNVNKEIRARNMTWTVQAGILFANLPFSPIAYDFSRLTFERYKEEDRAMVETILRELRPDYLVLMAEPDTQANLTGLREFNDPQKGVELVNYLLDGLDHAPTKICAGTGSWTPPDYARLLSEKTSLDCISIHVYPVNPQFIQNALRMAQDAHANGKSVIVPESWLYKTDQPGGGNNVAASADIFKLDAYSFWSPLDKKFIRLMTDFASKADVDFLSFFWSQFFFAYLDYAPSLDNASYPEIRERSNRAVFDAITKGELSPLGEFYQSLIQSR